MASFQSNKGRSASKKRLKLNLNDQLIDKNLHVLEEIEFENTSESGDTHKTSKSVHKFSALASQLNEEKMRIDVRSTYNPHQMNNWKD
jgi:hypothetical protein